jgi:hypothetical protein
VKSPARFILCTAAVMLAAVLTCSSRCAAHPATLSSADAKLDADGHVEVRFTFDLLAYVLNDTSARIPNEPMDELLDGPSDELKHQLADAAGRFSRSFTILADNGTAVPLDSLKFPSVEEVLAWKRSMTKDTRLPVVLELSAQAHLPAGTRSVAFRFPQVLDQVVLTVERPGEEAESFALEPGETSPALPVTMRQLNNSPGATQPSSPRFQESKTWVVVASASTLAGLVALMWMARRMRLARSR